MLLRAALDDRSKSGGVELSSSRRGAEENQIHRPPGPRLSEREMECAREEGGEQGIEEIAEETWRGEDIENE